MIDKQNESGPEAAAAPAAKPGGGKKDGRVARVKVLVSPCRLRSVGMAGDFIFGRGMTVERIPLADAEYKAGQKMIEILEVSEG